MKVNGEHYRTIWIDTDDERCIHIIDQRPLPHTFVVEEIRSVNQMATAIRDMHLRGAGLIGAAAAFGMYLAALEAFDSTNFEETLLQAADELLLTRPTAVNLSWAINRQLNALSQVDQPKDKVRTALETAKTIADEDAAHCMEIGKHGLAIIEQIATAKSSGAVNILTHCNAGWLAFVDHGSATAPIYAAHDAGIDVHVWVDETRPRNQGARLTAWELGQHGVPHTIVSDNAGGHLMQHGLVDVVFVGSDRTTYTGDVANKIGTYLKALAAADNKVPFYVALPSSSIDWGVRDGIKDIPIEERSEREIKYIQGKIDDRIAEVLITPEGSPAANYAFDITPAHLVSGLITERGLCEASQPALAKCFPERY